MLPPLCLDPKGQLHLTPADHCPLLGTLGPKADGSCSLPQKGSILLNLSWARSVWKTMSLLYPSCGPLHWHASGYPVSLPWGCSDHDFMFSTWSQLPGLVPGVSRVHNKCWASAWPPGPIARALGALGASVLALVRRPSHSMLPAPCAAGAITTLVI